GPSLANAALQSSTYIGAPPKTMLFRCSSDVSCRAGCATSRLTMVGAAKKQVLGQRLSSATISAGSNARDSGTTLTAALRTCGKTYSPEPWDSGAACSSTSPGETVSTSARKQRLIAKRLPCVSTAPFGRPVVPLV